MTRVRAWISQAEQWLSGRRPLLVVLGLIVLIGGLSLLGSSDTPVETERNTDRTAASEGFEAGEGGLDPSLATETADATGTAAAKAKSTAKSAGSRVGVDTPVSDTEIAVGMIYVTNPGATNRSLGISGSEGQINQKRAWEIMTKEVNRNAPFGRKVVPVFYSISEEEAINKGDSLWQEACAHWTKDRKVFLAWSGGTDTLRACLTKNRVAQIGAGSGLSWEKTFKDYPWYIEFNGASLDRMAEFEVDHLFARGFFSKCRTDPRDATCVDGQPRIALIRYDLASHKAGAAKMKAALASHGLSLCDGCEFEITFGATADVQAQLDDATEIKSAILNCKGSRTARGAQPGPCTHMLFLGSSSGCRMQFFYIQSAEEQQYRVRLGLNSQDCSTTQWDSQEPEWANNQLKQSLLVGHSPGEPFKLKPAAFNECKKLFTDGGETFGGSDDPSNNKEGQIDGYCDTAWYHIAAFNAVGRTVNLDTFLNGVANTGLVKSAGTFLMRTTATRHDGAGAIRIGEWDPGECRCHKPITGDIPV